MKRLFMIACIVALCYTLLAAAVVVVALTLNNRRGEGSVFPDVPTFVDNGERPPADIPDHFLRDPINTGDDDDDGGLLRPPSRTHFIMMGIDNQQLADAIMVGTFYRDSGEVRLMSVPRDLYIAFSATRHAQIREMGLNVPQHLKINELRAYGGSLRGPQLVMQELGDMLGVAFQYYVEVRIPAFRRVVDAIGGVYFNVPSHLYYVDPIQDLVIDVPAGYRRLNGTLAEGVVRYRGANADLWRNTMQMNFMTALLQQTLTREAIMNNPLELARTVIEEVSTNLTIGTLVPYLRYISSASAERITTFTMPGEGAYVGRTSIFVPNLNSLHDVTREVFYANIPVVEEAPEPEEDDEA